MWNILFLGLVSFFADISAEMVYPIIPLYLTSTFGATPALVGLIEGIAESLASLLKVFSGYISDRSQKKKRLAFFGYTTGLIYKIALILATSWVGILVARVIDRIGKGIRTSPRDVMVSESAPANQLGQAFGLHKALDMAGSAIGILLAYFIIQGNLNTSTYKTLFLVSMIPALIGLGLFAFIREQKNHPIKTREPFWKRVGELDNNLKLYLLVAFIFTLGNSSNTFLLLRAKSVGFTDSSVILLYFLYNLSASLLAFPFGKRSDKVGRRRILILGYLVFAFVYLGFGFAYNQIMIVSCFLLYGLYTAMITGVERAYIAEISPSDLKGTMLGLHSTLVGIALLPASLIAGVLWDLFGAVVPFIFGSSLALLAAILLVFFMPNQSLSSY
jgi:MFS family permease